MPLDQVSPDEILRSEGAAKPVKEGTFLQRTGLVLATGVGAAGVLVTFTLVGKWVLYAPVPPTLPTGADQNAIRAILDNYKTLQQIALEPFTTLFDLVVVKVLLPVFTAILGYIFGSRSAEKQE